MINLVKYLTIILFILISLHLYDYQKIYLVFPDRFLSKRLFRHTNILGMNRGKKLNWAYREIGLLRYIQQ